MDNEKMMVLKMLEQGKISSEEASRLLDSLKNETATKNTPNTSYSREVPGRGPSDSSPRPNSQNTRSSARDVTLDFSRKVESFAKDMEPKLQKVTQVVAEKTAMFADKVSKTLASPPVPDERPKSPPAPQKSGFGVERAFELKVNPGEMNEINMRGLNGYIFIKGYNGDKITSTVYCTPKNPGAKIDLMKLGSTYYLNYDENDFKSVNIEAYVPSSMMNRILFETTNGKITVEGLNADFIKLVTEKGEIYVTNVSAKEIKADTVDAKLSLNGIKADKGVFETSNQPIEATELDIAELSAETTNSPINLIISSFRRSNRYNWKIITSNARIKANFPSVYDTGYNIKAYTSLSGVSVGLTGLNYIRNDKNYVEAKSENYFNSDRKVDIELDTSNGSISINS